MRCCRFLPILLAAAALAQQATFIRIDAPNVPKGADYLFEDSHGGMWLAGCEHGSEGLTYFDGNQFLNPVKNYPHILVCNMTEDSQGGIWLAATTGLYRVFRGSVQRMFPRFDSNGWISRIAPDVFVFVSGSASTSKLVRVTQSKGTWKAEILITPAPAGNFPSDRSGNLFYGCAGGMCELNHDELIRWHPGNTFHVLASRPPNYFSILRDAAGCIWIRERDAASYQCPGDKQRTILPATVASIGPGPSPPLLELSSGSVVIVSFGKLAIGRPGNFRVLTPASGYPSACCALVTKDDSIWLSNANGLFVLPSHIPTEFWTEHEGLDGNTWSVLRDGSNMFAVAGDSICILEKDRSRWRPFAALPEATHLIAGPKHTILISSEREGIVQVDSQGQTIRRSEPAAVNTLAKAPNNTYWALGEKLWQIRFRAQTLDLQETDIGQAGWGTDLQADAAGILRVCRGNQVFRNEGLSWKQEFKTQFQSRNICPYFTADTKGHVWYEGNYGLTLLASPRRVTSTDDGPPTAGNFLNVDSRGWLWRGTAEGVYVAEPEQALRGNWLRLDRSDGFPATDANHQSFFEDTDGSIWYGADNSVIHISPPADVLHPRYAPDVFISAFSTNDGAPQMADLVGTIKSGTSITAYIGSLQFDRRNALRLRYRLLPEQNSWRETKNLNLSLGKLPSGAHTLEVQARLFTGPWSGTVSRSFTILQPVWITWPLLLTYLVTATVFVAGSWMLHRTRQAEERKLLPNLAEWRLGSLLPEVHDLAGTVLASRYEVGTVLARGGFANVLTGYDRALDRRCAIKIFRNEVKNKTSITHSFEREIAALQQIRHPHVVSIYAHGTTSSGSPYLVMEFVEGKSLREVLEKGPLKNHRTARLLSQLADALDAIHAQGICHRDVKPENIIVRREKKNQEHAVLIDFSIAIIKDANETLYGISRAAGTFDYMGPEQAVGYAQPSSDIYALAKLIIEMLTGERVTTLFPNAALELPLRVRGLLQTRDFRLSAESIERFATALEFDPTKRPNRASAFAAPIVRDLESID